MPPPHAAFAALTALAVSGMGWLPPAEERAEPQAGFRQVVQPFVERYCAACHDAELAEGELDLLRYDSARAVAAEPEIWRRVAERVEAGEMPPPGARRRPAALERAQLLVWLEAALESAASPGPGSQRTVLRRLTRREYQNTVRDLFGVEYPALELFPADAVADGFDNLGQAQTLSPLAFERLFEAAETIANEALLGSDPRSVRAEAEQLRSSRDFGLRHGARSMHTNGQVFLELALQRSGRYEIRIRAAASRSGKQLARLDLMVDNDIRESFDVAAARDQPELFTATLELDSGTQRIAAAFNNDHYEPEHADPALRDRNLYVYAIEISGPQEQRATPFRSRFVEPFERAAEREPPSPAGSARAAQPPTQYDLDALLAHLAERVWRRAPEPSEVAELRDLSPADAQPDELVRTALVALLVSPRFLFRPEYAEPGQAEPDGQHQAGSAPARPVADSWTLASRLSYFLWSSAPDERLLEAARQGRLLDDAELHREVERLLRDARSSELARNFARQWLQLESLDLASPDPARFPRFDAELRRSMLAETELFLDAVAREDRALSELLVSDFTFANEALAELYGLPGVDGPSMRRVPIPAHLARERGGLLTQASVLTVTSNPTRTSPVLRGKYVLEVLLGAPPPPPPPGIGALEESTGSEDTASLRQRLEQHRSDPSCAVCHAPMDALGFALENYDPIGAWRTHAGAHPLDTASVLPDGRAVEDPRGLSELLAGDEQLALHVAERLATYALGRRPSALERLSLSTALAERRDPTLRELVHLVVDLPGFRQVRAIQ